MNGIFAPQLGVTPLTIVAIMKESEDSLLLAADRQITGDAIRVLRLKLRKVPNQQIAWSSSGNSSIGLGEFGHWLERYDFDGKDWWSFGLDAADKLSELNGNQRKRTELSRAKLRDEDICAAVLIAGWLKGEIRAFALTSVGILSDALEGNFNAIGNGGDFAVVAKTAIEMCGVNLDCFTTLRFTMESVAGHVVGCNAPIDIWRINKDFIEDAMRKGNTREKGVSRKQIHQILDKASHPIKKSGKGKS